MGAEQFGGGAKKIPKSKIKKSQQGGSHAKKKGCCPMVEAGHAVRRRKFRLARRYAAMSVRLIAARAVA